MTRLRASATAHLLALFVLFTALRVAIGLADLEAAWLAISPASPLRPWTFVTAVYTHGSLGHLLSNALAVGIAGRLLERSTTTPRLHGFVLCTGSLSGIAEVLVAAAFGHGVAVLGASGAAMALFGYVLVANPLAERIEMDRWARIAVLLGLALVVAAMTFRPGVAIVAHATGFLLGALGGWKRVLRPENAILK